MVLGAVLLALSVAGSSTGVSVSFLGGEVHRARSAAGTSIFSGPLEVGDEGEEVRALQIRVAGWFPSRDQVQFVIDGRYGLQTAKAVERFRGYLGLKLSGRASRRVLKRLERLQDPDGSTAHFDWEEFTQNSSASCSANANAYAGTFGGGKVSPRKVKRNIKRLMWRLEAIRAKAGEKPIGINSAFRSVTYNECIGGASASEHLYGAAVDSRVVETENGAARDIARGSQVHGIGCYSELSHNHFDIRLENIAWQGTRGWWWPDTDKKGRDLDEEGKLCWGQGETKLGAESAEDSQIVVGGVVISPTASGSSRPSEQEVEAFEEAGEPSDYQGGD